MNSLREICAYVTLRWAIFFLIYSIGNLDNPFGIFMYVQSLKDKDNNFYNFYRQGVITLAIRGYFKAIKT